MQKIKQSFLTIVIGLALAAGLSYAAPWVGPTANPPADNVEAPLNVGISTQYKAGALGVGGLLRAYGPAIFDGKIKIGDDAVSPVAGSIRWTGTDFEGYDGTLWKSFTAGEIITPPSYKIAEMRIKKFTANGVFEVPSGVTTVWVSLIGGGGGGGGGFSLTDKSSGAGIGTPGGGGGRSQLIHFKQLSVSSGAKIPVTVGAGGAGGISPLFSKSIMTSNGKDGQNGGNSSFGDFVSAAGGGGGKIGVVYSKGATAVGLGGALGGQKGKCAGGGRQLSASPDLCYGEAGTSIFEDQYGGATDTLEQGAGTITEWGCATGGDGTTLCGVSLAGLSPAHNGQDFGNGGGGGISIIQPIYGSPYVSNNGGNGKGGYVNVYWCDAGYSRVGDICQEG